MRGRLPSWLLLAILVVFTLNVSGVFVLFSGVEATPGAKMFVDPATTIDTSKVPGSQFTTSVNASDIPSPGILSYQFKMNYSSDILGKPTKPLSNMNFTDTLSQKWVTQATYILRNTTTAGIPTDFRRLDSADLAIGTFVTDYPTPTTIRHGTNTGYYYFDPFTSQSTGTGTPSATALKGYGWRTSSAWGGTIPAGTWTFNLNITGSGSGVGHIEIWVYSTTTAGGSITNLFTIDATGTNVLASSTKKVYTFTHSGAAYDLTTKILVVEYWLHVTSASSSPGSETKLSANDPSSQISLPGPHSGVVGAWSYGYDATHGYPPPGSGSPSYYLRANSTSGAVANVLLYTEQFFNWTMGAPLAAYFKFAYNVSGNSIGTTGFIQARLFRPDGTYSAWTAQINLGNLKTGVNSWSYNMTEETAADFAQSGTYRIKLRVFLRTALAGTSNYVQVNWDNVQISLVKIDVTQGNFFTRDSRNTPNEVFFTKKFFEPNIIYVAETLTGIPGVDVWPVSGNGRFATITWNVSGTGDTPLHLYDTKMLDPEDNLVSHEVQDGYFANIAVTHDAAVTFISLNDTTALDGEGVRINATVVNQGTVSETFDVTAYYDTTLIQTKTITLGAGLTTHVLFDWATGGVPPGSHTIKVVAETLIGETDTADNTYIDGIVIVTYTHNISILEVKHDAPANVAYKGQIVTVNVTVRNKGTVAESFTVSAYNSTTAFETQPIVGLAANTNATLLFHWNTTTASAPNTYVIKADATIVTGEIYTVDNVLTDGTVNLQLWRDVAVTDVSVSPTSVHGNQNVTIRVTVANQGQRAETFPVKVYYNDTLINSTSVSALDIGASRVLTFTWTTLDSKKPVTNMNFTATTPGQAVNWTTTPNVITGIGTYGNNSALGAGNPLPGGSGTPSYFHRVNSTGAAIGNAEFVTEQSFSWTLGTPVKAYLNFAYNISGFGIDTAGSIISIVLVKPDLTQVNLVGPYAFSSLGLIVGWKYNTTQLLASHFTQSGTYKLQIKSTLKTNNAATGRYVDLKWDDVGLLLRPPLGTSVNYIKAEALMAEDLDQSNNIVGAPYDINGDRKADATDWTLLMAAYGSKPGDSNWNPNADLNKDGVISILDINLLGRYYDKTKVQVTTP